MFLLLVRLFWTFLLSSEFCVCVHLLASLTLTLPYVLSTLTLPYVLPTLTFASCISLFH